jgi:hypothetical protein
MQKEIFEQLRKLKIIGETALLCKKKIKMHALSSKLQHFSINDIPVRKLHYPTPTRIYKVKGAI